jgi:hypothetical protein
MRSPSNVSESKQAVIGVSPVKQSRFNATGGSIDASLTLSPKEAHQSATATHSSASGPKIISPNSRHTQRLAQREQDRIKRQELLQQSIDHQTKQSQQQRELLIQQTLRSSRKEQECAAKLWQTMQLQRVVESNAQHQQQQLLAARQATLKQQEENTKLQHEQSIQNHTQLINTQLQHTTQLIQQRQQQKHAKHIRYARSLVDSLLELVNRTIDYRTLRAEQQFDETQTSFASTRAGNSSSSALVPRSVWNQWCTEFVTKQHVDSEKNKDWLSTLTNNDNNISHRLDTQLLHKSLASF